MTSQSAQIQRIVYLRINPHEDLLQAIREGVRQNNIASGVILNGIGSLGHYRAHVVKTTSLPPGDVVFEGEGPYDILSLTGLIIAGRIHAHLTISDTEKAMGGHLEKGCRVLTFALIAIAETPEADFTEWDAVKPI